MHQAFVDQELDYTAAHPEEIRDQAKAFIADRDAVVRMYRILHWLAFEQVHAGKPKLTDILIRAAFVLSLLHTKPATQQKL